MDVFCFFECFERLPCEFYVCRFSRLSGSVRIGVLQKAVNSLDVRDAKASSRADPEESLMFY